MVRSPSTALLIKDETRNVFYELEDPRDVQDRCVIKIYCKEPIYGTYPGHHNPHLANGDLRVRPQPPYSPVIFRSFSSPHFRRNFHSFSLLKKAEDEVFMQNSRGFLLFCISSLPNCEVMQGKEGPLFQSVTFPFITESLCLLLDYDS